MIKENYTKSTKKFLKIISDEMPHLMKCGQITRDDMKAIVSKHDLTFPQQLTKPENIVSRGVYKLDFNRVENQTVNDYSLGSSLNVSHGTIEPDFNPVSVVETMDEMNNRITETYKSMDILINSIARGIAPSLIISGAPGLGKSYQVKQQLNYSNCNYIFHRGFLKATHLFRLLYENRFKNQILVLDDVDSIFDDLTSLNILKAALELCDNKTIGWGSDRQFKDDDGLDMPRYFEYSGSVIFLTNIDFQNKSKNKLSVHLAALDSRCLALDLNIRTELEIFCRLKQVVLDSNICSDKGVSDFLRDELLIYIELNLMNFKELSIRTVEKLIALVATEPLYWENLADRVLLR